MLTTAMQLKCTEFYEQKQLTQVLTNAGLGLCYCCVVYVYIRGILATMKFGIFCLSAAI
jgi:hypothetical protein